MSLLDELRNQEAWMSFRNYKTEHGQLTASEVRKLDVFIMEKRYLDVSLDFDYPVRHEITKSHSGKKRVVYSYSEDETWFLKLLAWLMYRYDGSIEDNCYSFRRNCTARTVFDQILTMEDLDDRHVLKADIHDYFNSIDVERLIRILYEVIDDDTELLNFITSLLRQKYCYWNGTLIEDSRGAMAGMPLASFLANIYLGDLDRCFAKFNIPYFRYSDDILILCRSQQELNDSRIMLEKMVSEAGLTMNPDKYVISSPEQPWEYLGFRYCKGKIDLSGSTVRKMKDRISRKARSFYRRRTRKDLSYEVAARALIRSLDYRLYDLTGDNPFTWTRFYFPVISCTDGLHAIDQTMIQYLRYLYSGRHYKGNYAVDYAALKSLGYTSLVNEYHSWKKDNYRLLKQNN